MDGEDLGLIDGSGTEESEIEGGEETFIEDDGGEGAREGEGAGEGERAPREGEEGEGEGEGERGRRVDRADLPLQLRKAFRANPELAKQFPKLEKQLTGVLFKANTVDQLGGVQKFREYAETLEAHGGPEGVAEMATELEDWHALDAGFKTGDPKIIDAWVKDYPDGFKALLGPAIEKMMSLDSPGADRILSAPMWNILDRCGVITTIGALEAALAKLKPEDAAEAIKEFKAMKGFFADLRGLAVKSKSPDPLAGERKILADREAEMNDNATKAFYGSVRSDVNTQVMQRMNKLIRTELAGAQIKLSVANRLRKEINAELNRTVNTAPGYADRYKAVMATGDKDRAVRFILSAAFAKMPSVVKQLVSEFNIPRGRGGNGNGAGRREGGARSSGEGGGSRTVNGRPKTSEIDFTKTDKSRWLATMNSHGTAFLLNGKIAKW